MFSESEMRKLSDMKDTTIDRLDEELRYFKTEHIKELKNKDKNIRGL
jgi:hypothetical protein